ncbi:hypothetical protein ACN082_09755 [Rothia sp. CCM 9417]|uniref:hypothetical protein n=1 Tax=Rothia sp. CCM 9417 TaxID=3402657 RepID=UPI003AEE3799
MGDFHVLFRVDIFELIWSNDHTLLDSLLERLKHEERSLFKAAVNGYEYFGYGTLSRQIDDVHDLLAIFRHEFLSANSDKDAELPEPLFAQRPGKKKDIEEEPVDEEQEILELMSWV